MSSYSEKRLPTAEEYREAEGMTLLGWSNWSNPMYLCPCGGNMRKNLTIRLCTEPEAYMYVCDKCGHIEYQFV